MLVWAYWSAVVLAFAGIERDNRAAIPLLGSAAFCYLAQRFDWQFHLLLWLSVDVLVAAAVAWPLYPIIRARAWVWLRAYWRELVILALFVPAIGAYALPEDPRHVVSSLAAIAQLLVSVPYGRLARRWRGTMLRHEDWAHFDMRIAAG